MFLFFNSLLSNSYNFIGRSLNAIGPQNNNNELIYKNASFDRKQFVLPFDTKYKNVTVKNYKLWYDNFDNTQIFECYEHFLFEPKKIIYNVINWENILKSLDVVFDALTSHKDIIKIINLTKNMKKHVYVQNLRYYFKIFVIKFLTNQPAKIKLRPIGHLFEFLAYHSYDLIFDLSFYSSFEDANEIKKIKKLVYRFIDVRMKEFCPWHVIQLYSELMYSDKRKNPLDTSFVGSRG
ncbi:uncharacterized protein VNE69_08002 [Vairimorpha necatrix]|uniref:Uncharacterized protein n=1 Tax=Vairimorpha necatrix TaxID=6039 RepID=A0AAX4JE16_9MICR